MVHRPGGREALYGAGRQWGRTGIGLVAAIVSSSVTAFGQALRSSALTSVSTTSVVGMVGDSLHGGPLAGAVVMLDGLAREAVTDSIGRFRIDSVAAGQYRLGVFHPILDSLGTSLASQPVRLRAGRPILISLATPSGRTIRRAFCPGWRRNTPRYEHADSGVALLVGRVVDPESEGAVTDATVTLSWIETAFGDASTHLTPYQRSTTTDATGEFRFCAIPSGLSGLLRATIHPDARETVEREVDLENRIVTMATMHLSANDTLGADHPRAELMGVIERPDGSPLAGATAVVQGTADSVVTGSDGTFAIHGLPSGTHMVHVRSVGFEPVSDVVELTNHEPQHVSIALTTPARVPNAVLVAAHRLQAGYARVGFDRRQLEGEGQFLTADDIADKHAPFLSVLLAGTMGAQVANPPLGTNPSASQTVASCVAFVLDGYHFNRVVDGNLDALYHPDEIAGIEIYSGESVPGEFRGSASVSSEARDGASGPAQVRSGASVSAPLRGGSSVPGQSRIGASVPSEARSGAPVASEAQGSPLPGAGGAGSLKQGTEACATVVVWTKAHLGVSR